MSMDFITGHEFGLATDPSRQEDVLDVKVAADIVKHNFPSWPNTKVCDTAEVIARFRFEDEVQPPAVRQLAAVAVHETMVA